MVSFLALILVSPQIAKIALKFGATELFSLLLWAGVSEQFWDWFTAEITESVNCGDLWFDVRDDRLGFPVGSGPLYL